MYVGISVLYFRLRQVGLDYFHTAAPTPSHETLLWLTGRDGPSSFDAAIAREAAYVRPSLWLGRLWNRGKNEWFPRLIEMLIKWVDDCRNVKLRCSSAFEGGEEEDSVCRISSLFLFVSREWRWRRLELPRLRSTQENPKSFVNILILLSRFCPPVSASNTLFFFFFWAAAGVLVRPRSQNSY